MRMNAKTTPNSLRAIKIRAAVEVLGGLGLVAIVVALIYAPSLVFGGDPTNDGRPLVVLARCASAQ